MLISTRKAQQQFTQEPLSPSRLHRKKQHSYKGWCERCRTVHDWRSGENVTKACIPPLHVTELFDERREEVVKVPKDYRAALYAYEGAGGYYTLEGVLDTFFGKNPHFPGYSVWLRDVNEETPEPSSEEDEDGSEETGSNTPTGFEENDNPVHRGENFVTKTGREDHATTTGGESSPTKGGQLLLKGMVAEDDRFFRLLKRNRTCFGTRNNATTRKRSNSRSPKKAGSPNKTGGTTTHYNPLNPESNPATLISEQDIYRKWDNEKGFRIPEKLVQKTVMLEAENTIEKQHSLVRNSFVYNEYDAVSWPLTFFFGTVLPNTRKEIVEMNQKAKNLSVPPTASPGGDNNNDQTTNEEDKKFEEPEQAFFDSDLWKRFVNQYKPGRTTSTTGAGGTKNTSKNEDTSTRPLLQMKLLPSFLTNPKERKNREDAQFAKFAAQLQRVYEVKMEQFLSPSDEQEAGTTTSTSDGAKEEQADRETPSSGAAQNVEQQETTEEVQQDQDATSSAPASATRVHILPPLKECDAKMRRARKKMQADDRCFKPYEGNNNSMNYDDEFFVYARWAKF
ncbi:unnamed protein product [Amoebophrya sp. A120]|nr:unnamed protein product [Amoebophrya sp. A120]|eukprot:GSA120T00009194001.1